MFYLNSILAYDGLCVKYDDLQMLLHVEVKFPTIQFVDIQAVFSCLYAASK